MQALRHYLLAVQFFTRIPITGRLAHWIGFSPALLRAASGHFPGVGWMVAAVALLTYAALQWALAWSLWASAVAAVGSTIATVLLTGGFHEDGLADVADGLGGSAPAAQALDIMKDSRIGAYGSMALVLALLAKCALLALLGGHSLGAALAALGGAHVLSRLWPLALVVRYLPHVGDTARSKSKPLADQISGRSLATALCWTALPLGCVAQMQGGLFLGAALGASALAAWRMQALFARRLGGFTGDCLGATQQVGEIAFYLGAALTLGVGSP